MFVGNVHVVAGNAKQIPAVEALFEKEGIEMHGNPDVYVRTYQGFGADEARELKQRASLRAIGSSSRVFVIATPGMTGEAQNALLKTLEEPPGDARFVFIVPSPDTLLPTFRSRCQILALSARDGDVGAVDVKEFLAAGAEARLEMLKPLLDKDEDEKRDMGAILAFLSSLERLLSESAERDSRGLRAIYRARKFATDKGALLKPLLEQVALLMPRTQ